MTQTDSPASAPERRVWPAVLRGLRLRCPACGTGALMHRYLKVRDTCPACHADLSHQRADDGPAYLTMFVTLKIVVPAMVYVMFNHDVNRALLLTLSIAAMVGLTLFLLPRFKGLVVAVQWALRMHGFDGARHD